MISSRTAKINRTSNQRAATWWGQWWPQYQLQIISQATHLSYKKAAVLAIITWSILWWCHRWLIILRRPKIRSKAPSFSRNFMKVLRMGIAIVRSWFLACMRAMLQQLKWWMKIQEKITRPLSSTKGGPVQAETTVEIAAWQFIGRRLSTSRVEVSGHSPPPLQTKRRSSCIKNLLLQQTCYWPRAAIPQQCIPFSENLQITTNRRFSSGQLRRWGQYLVIRWLILKFHNLSRSNNI